MTTGRVFIENQGLSHDTQLPLRDCPQLLRHITVAHGLMQCCAIQPERHHNVLNYELYYALDTDSLIFVVVVAG